MTKFPWFSLQIFCKDFPTFNLKEDNCIHCASKFRRKQQITCITPLFVVHVFVDDSDYLWYFILFSIYSKTFFVHILYFLLIIYMGFCCLFFFYLFFMGFFFVDFFSGIFFSWKQNYGVFFRFLLQKTELQCTKYMYVKKYIINSCCKRNIAINSPRTHSIV